MEILRCVLPQLRFFRGEHRPRRDPLTVSGEDNFTPQHLESLVRKPGKIMNSVLTKVQGFELG